MTNLKILTTTDTYREMTAEYEGIPILMRHYFKVPAVHIRADDNFARANGYNSMEEIYQIDPMMRVVEWIDADMFGDGFIAAVIGPAQIRPQTVS